MPGRGHPHQTISILRRERALKRIATFAKTEMRAKTTKIIATDFLHTFREELLGTFTFEELVAYCKRAEVIKTAKVAIVRALHLVSFLCENEPDADLHQRANIRVCLAGEFIARYEDRVFAEVNEESTNLVIANNSFRQAAYELFDKLRNGILPRDIDRSLLKNFRVLHNNFHKAFNVWKVPDEAMLLSRIRNALLALYSAQSNLTPEDQGSPVGTQIRDQIDRLRAKWVQIAGTPSLHMFDSDRVNMRSLMQELDPLGAGNDGPVRRHGSLTVEGGYRYSMNNEELAHELLLDPGFRFTEENMHRLCHPTLRVAAQERMDIFYAHMEADLGREPPVITCPMKVLTEVREALVDIAEPGSRNTIAVELDIVAMRALMMNESNYSAIFDCFAAVIRRVQAPSRASAFQRSSEAVRAEMDSAATHGARATAMSKAMRLLLDSVNRCRMDSANSRLGLVSRVVADHGIEYEQGKFQEKLASGVHTMSRTLDWLKRASEGRELDDLETMCRDAFADLLLQTHEFPETFSLDLFRLREMRTSFYNIAIGSAVLVHCYAFNGRGHSMMLINQTAQYFRDINDAKPSVEGLSIALLGCATSEDELSVKRDYLRGAQPFFAAANPMASRCMESIAQLLRHYLKEFNMGPAPIQALTHFYDMLLDRFRVAQKIWALNIKVHHENYVGLAQRHLMPAQVDQLADRLSLTSIAANLRVVLPVDPVLVVPGFTVANGTMTIEFFSTDSPFERHRKASTGLLYAQANSPEQRTLITVLTGAIREGGDIPPDPELPDDLGI